jgi:hypothetical protein
MATTGHIFPYYQFNIYASGGVNPVSPNRWWCALSNAAGPVTLANVATMQSWSDWTGTYPEITGTGYTAGGVQLTNVGGSGDPHVGFAGSPSNQSVYLLIENPSWAGATFSANQAIFYGDFGGSSKYLVGYMDFGGSVSVVSDTFTVSIPSNQILSQTVT